MTRAFAASLTALLLATSPAMAQQLDVPFVIEEDGQAAGCLWATVRGLDPNGDGFLAVRSGPGSNYRKLGEIYNGDQVRYCARAGKWMGIYYGSPRRVGWAHSNWLAVSPAG